MYADDAGIVASARGRGVGTTTSRPAPLYRHYRSPTPLGPGYMNLHTSTYVLFAQVFHFTKLPCLPRFRLPAREGKKDGGAAAPVPRRCGTGGCVQTGGYVPVQMSPRGARITVTYEAGNTYSRHPRTVQLRSLWDFYSAPCAGRTCPERKKGNEISGNPLAFDVCYTYCVMS